MSDEGIGNKVDAWMRHVLFWFLSSATIGGIWLLVGLYEAKIGGNHMGMGLPIMLFTIGIMGLIVYDDIEKVVRWWLLRKNH